MKSLPKSLDPFDLKGCFIAGGAVLSAVTKTDIADYDVYPKSNQAMIDAFAQLLDDSCYVVNITDRAVTFKSNRETNNNGERAIVQVMTYDTFETADKIFSNFDFTVCMGAFDCDEQKYIFHEDFYPDIASRTLRFNTGTKYPLNSLLRVAKYQTKGYFISKPEMIKMALTVINNGMPTSWDELEAAIGGSYGREIKLNVGDKEFSFLAAIELLSGIQNIDHYLDVQESFSDTKFEELEDLYSDKEKRIIVNSEGNYFLIGENGLPIRDLKTAKPRKYVIINADEDYQYIGYKMLEDKGNGNYAPGIQTYSNFVYSLTEDAVCTSWPYLYVFPTLSQAKSRLSSYKKNQKIFLVSYNASDIMAVSGKEIQVKRMKLVEEVTIE